VNSARNCCCAPNMHRDDVCASINLRRVIVLLRMLQRVSVQNSSLDPRKLLSDGAGHCRMSTECCAFWTMGSDVGVVTSPLTSHRDWVHRSTSGPEHDHPYLRRHLRVVSTTPTLHSTATSGGPKHHGDNVRLLSLGPSHGSHGDKGPHLSATPQRRNPSHRVNAEGMRHLGRMQETR
jgi:hypothetical protein